MTGRQIQCFLEVCKYCAPYHFVPRLKTVANIDTVLAGVENGLGVAILDEWTHGIHHPDIGSFEIRSRHPISLPLPPPAIRIAMTL